MHKISWEALIARFVPHSGCGPNSIYTRIKVCEKQFGLLLLEYSLEVLSRLLHTQRKTCIDR